LWLFFHWLFFNPSKSRLNLLYLKKTDNMLDQLLKTLISQGQSQVIDNPEIPNELNQQVIGEAGRSIVDGLQGALAGGGLSQIMNMFTGGSQQGQGSGLMGLISNPLVQNIIQSFAGRLTSQYNLNPATASQLGSQLIPGVLGRLSQQVSDPNDSSMDINSVIQSLTGGQLGGTNFNDLAGRFAGRGAAGDVDGDGDVDLQDIIASVSGAAGAQRNASSGIMDMIGQFMR
jgi:hypothetical protein